MAVGQDGALWYSGFEGTGRIGRISRSGTVTRFDLPRGGVALDLTTDPGRAVWFTDGGLDRIGRITTDGRITEFALPDGAQPAQITAARGGALWFSEVRTT